ncbi:MAG: phospholipid carrier-dependent glycosyltransferase [Myxococcales bacterium]|nr:phospholipid carrier-dependent glycosyltransferase [Myxococcales bacterium]
MNNRRAMGLCLAFIAFVLLLRSLVVAEPHEILTRTDVGELRHFSGSWHFPRGGPYVLGYEASEDTKLFIDDKLIVRGKGEQKERIVYQPGSFKVRVETAGTFRLLWHPPGRRGPLEYVPSSSLAPDGTTPAFTRPGTSLFDGLCALSIVLSVILCIAFVGRDSIRACDKQTWRGIALVFVGAILVRLIGLGDQGQTWDEDVNWSAGRNYITNLLSLDFSDSSWRWNYQHPPVMKYLAGIGAQFSDGYGPSRAISALLVALACALLVPIGHRLFRLRVGLLAGVVAALAPHLIAHGQVVGHEAPTVFFWALAMWLALRAHDESTGRCHLHKRFVALGIVLGLAVFSRYINGLIAPLIGLVLLAKAPPEQRKKTVALGFAIIPVVALLTCVAVWPRLWSEPILHMQESWAKLKQPHGAEPYLGVLTDSPGRSYFFVYLWATAPLGLLVFAKLWLVRAAVLRERASLLLALWILIPMVVTFSPVRQDGVRYIMPSVFALCLACAAGIDFLARRTWHRHLFVTVSVALGVYLSVVCLRIRPFYLDYYGEQVGGPAEVAKKRQFEIAWWGEGMNQALDYLNREAAVGARVYKRCFEPGHLAWMRGDLWVREAHRPKDADWFLVYQPLVRKCPIPNDATLVFESRARGAPIARVYRRRSDH